MMTPIQIAEELEKIFREADTVWAEYAVAKANYENLSEHKKTMLAQSFNGSPASSDKKKEMDAVTNPAYVNFLKGLTRATTEYTQAYARVKGLEIRLACMQSLNKSITEELKHNTST